MMYSGVLALSALLATTVSAVPMHGARHPHHKRDVVWVTETNIDTVVIPVTKTVWVDGKGHEKHRSTSTATSTSVAVSESASTESASAYSAPATSAETSETSVPVAPETTSSSTSEYVAPTTTSVYVAPTTSSTSEYVAPTTSSTSEYVAPTTSSTSEYVAPAPTTTSTPEVLPTTSAVYVAPTTSTAAAASPTSTSAGGDNGGYDTVAGAENTGDLTWYQTGLGACGVTNGSDDPIVAIAEAVFDAYSTGNPNTNPLCGRQVSITGKDGNQHKATVVDRCTGCKASDLDLSEGFFNTVTDNGDGRVSGMSWTWA